MLFSPSQIHNHRWSLRPSYPLLTLSTHNFHIDLFQYDPIYLSIILGYLLHLRQ